MFCFFMLDLSFARPMMFPHLGLAMQVVTIHSPNLLGSMDSYWLRTTHNLNRQAINAHRIDLIWIEVIGTIGKKIGPILLAIGHSDFSIRCRRYTRHCSRPHFEKIAAAQDISSSSWGERCPSGDTKWLGRRGVSWMGTAGRGSWSLLYIYIFIHWLRKVIVDWVGAELMPGSKS